MTNDEEVLKPCPFCGYEKPSIIIDEYAPIPYLGYGGGIEENVTCPQCLCHVDKKIWNTRKPSGKELRALDETLVMGWLRSYFNPYPSPDTISGLAKDFCSKFAAPSPLSVEDILEILASIPSTEVPISKINGKIYYYMCKENIAQVIYDAIKGAK